MTTRSKLFLLGFALILLWVNSQIYVREKQIAEGRVVILKLAPVDPRSLMQGDYMILGYDLAEQIPEDQSSGLIHLQVDERGLAQSFSPTAESGTVPLRFRRHHKEAVFGVESYLFQEGMREVYEKAEYSELRVTREGAPHLIRLLDKDFRPISDK